LEQATELNHFALAENDGKYMYIVLLESWLSSEQILKIG